LVTGNLQTPAALDQASAGAQTVYHCAARVGYWDAHREFQVDIVDATRNVAQACRVDAHRSMITQFLRE
jgi:nucleoside-diphosphate-sugar epimerase